MGWAFLDRMLTHGNDVCLLLNPSVNAYLPPRSPLRSANQIEASAVDRGSMIRIPIGNEKSMRLEVRSVAPENAIRRSRIAVSSRIFNSPRQQHLEDQEPAPGRALLARQHLRRLGELPQGRMDDDHFSANVKGRYADLKQASADRCRALGTFIKAQEVQFHHQVYNQFLWNLF